MFYGLGAGKGWNEFKFIVTPSEFEQLFEDLTYCFVITNFRVEIDYMMTASELVFEGYERLFNEILVSNIEFSQKLHWQIVNGIRISITDSLDKIMFKPIADERIKERHEFKVVNPTEPVVGLSPFYLYSANPDSISVAYDNAPGIIGLQFSFPKFVSLEVEGYAINHETSKFGNFRLFEELVRRVKEMSCKAKVKTPNKLLRPNFWISSNAAASINNNYFLKTKDLSVL